MLYSSDVGAERLVDGGVEGDPQTNGGSTNPRDDRPWSDSWFPGGIRAGCRHDVARLQSASADAAAVVSAHRAGPPGVAGLGDDGRRAGAATADAATGLKPTAPTFPS